MTKHKSALQFKRKEVRKLRRLLKAGVMSLPSLKKDSVFTHEDFGHLLDDTHPDSLLQLVFNEFEDDMSGVVDELENNKACLQRFNEDWDKTGYLRYKELSSA